VSDAHQDTGAQHHALLTEATRRNLDVIQVFDVTASGYTGQQEQQLTKLVDGLKRGRYCVVICWAIDRLTRQGVSETLQAVNRITKAGGSLISLQEPWIETAGEMRDLRLAVLGWVANFESRRRSERIKAGLAKRRAAGLPVGRKPGAKDRKPRKVSGYYLKNGR
jgi:DNA invertase Pin-like site-specific DNA recombinase